MAAFVMSETKVKQDFPPKFLRKADPTNPDAKELENLFTKSTVVTGNGDTGVGASIINTPHVALVLNGVLVTVTLTLNGGRVNVWWPVALKTGSNTSATLSLQEDGVQIDSISLNATSSFFAIRGPLARTPSAGSHSYTVKCTVLVGGTAAGSLTGIVVEETTP